MLDELLVHNLLQRGLSHSILDDRRAHQIGTLLGGLCSAIMLVQMLLMLLYSINVIMQQLGTI